jgi:hypothetical protein
VFELFASIERSAPSIWMREDAYAYFVALILHAFGMALLVGGGIVISLRRMGFASRAELASFHGFHPVMLLGAFLLVVSGFALLAAYPAKALTNPLFAVKFACLIGAALLLRAKPHRGLAALALALWLAGVAAGKLLLHTAKILTVT